MRRNIFVLLFMLFSVTAMASQLDVNCGPFGYFYRLKEFTLPNEKEPSVGLMNSDNLFQKHKDYVWSKVYTKNIETCSVLDEGFAIGGKNPVANIENIESTPAYEEFNGRFLKKIFKCFCKINPNVLNNCTMYVSYDAVNCGHQSNVCENQSGYKGNFICSDGLVDEEVRSVPPMP
ncbi:MAG: hypothetical protein NTY22_03330 [Proteobacteria bacterium]|nr:hypothetical protein [Pseudomonadota bacterium]